MIQIRKLARNWKWLFLLLLLFLIPLPMDAYMRHILVYCVIYSLVAEAWNVVTGYTGLFTMSVAGFFGLGAYISALSAINFGIPPVFSMLIGSLVTCFIGLILGLSSIRLGGVYLGIVTLAAGEIIRAVISNEVSITRGPLGLSVPPMFFAPDMFSYKLYYFYFALVVFIIMMYSIRVLINSPIGLIFKSIRGSEIAAESIGINVTRYKLLSFVVSSFLMGLGGALYAHYVQLISPEAANLTITFMIVTMVLLGGVATLAGPVIGAVTLTISLEALRVVSSEVRLLAYGSILVLVVMFVPGGLNSIYLTLRGKEKTQDHARS